MKTPLPVLSKWERLRRLAALSQRLDSNGSPIPQGLTDEEERAALLAPLNPARQETYMETRPGWLTTEFWKSFGLTYGVLPVLFAMSATGGTVPGGGTDTLAGGAPQTGLWALAVPLAAKALGGLIVLAITKINTNYVTKRSGVKTSQIEAKRHLELAKLAKAA